MTTRITTRLLAAAALFGLSAGAHANGIVASPIIYVLPANAEINILEGTATLELFMDFTGVQTIGGGIDIATDSPGGQLSLLEFIPSSYFLTATDPFFTGFGTTVPAIGIGDPPVALPPNTIEIHFGNFGGLTGLNKLGDIVIGLNSPGPGNLNISINDFYGGFFSTGGEALDVALSGASLQVVPVPAAAWLFVSAIGALGGMRLRRAA
jgi:hypothetical protein